MRKIQQGWRESWNLLTLQLDICSMMWINEDERRGLSHTAALFNEQQEHSLRIQILREDLRERKANHMKKMFRYRKQLREFKEWEAEQQAYEEARAMLGIANATSSAHADSVGEAREEKRRPPTRPVFTLFGPPGHFRRLAESLAKIQEAERAQAERDWKRKDTARMEAYVQEAEELAAEEKAKFRQKGREAAAPVAGKASQNGASAASVQPVLS